jgi:hypothetical protein
MATHEAGPTRPLDLPVARRLIEIDLVELGSSPTSFPAEAAGQILLRRHAASLRNVKEEDSAMRRLRRADDRACLGEQCPHPKT